MAGQPCAQDATGTCGDSSTLLECYNGVYRGVRCGGSGGCLDVGSTIYCDQSNVEPGDACLHVSEGQTICAGDGLSVLRCTNGNFAIVDACGLTSQCGADLTTGEPACGGSGGPGGGTGTPGPNDLYVLTVVSGTVTQNDPTGQTWDAAGGLPDPFVCLTIGGTRTCTTTAQDTLTPKWNFAFPVAKVSSLEAGIVVEIWDEDLTSNDPICGKGTVPFAAANLTSGTWSAQCMYGSFTATLAKQ